MNDDNNQIVAVRNAPSGLNLSVEDQKLDATFQKFLTDPDPLHMAFYCAFSGWRVVYNTSSTEMLGSKKTMTTEEYVLDSQARILNESGTNYIFSTVKPLVSPLVMTSNLSDLDLYNQWSATITTITYALAESYLKGNPYDLKIYRLSDIVSMILRLYTITANAKGGFKMKELAESFVTSVIQHNGLEQKKEGALEKIQNAFGGKK